MTDDSHMRMWTGMGSLSIMLGPAPRWVGRDRIHAAEDRMNAVTTSPTQMFSRIGSCRGSQHARCHRVWLKCYNRAVVRVPSALPKTMEKRVRLGLLAEPSLLTAARRPRVVPCADRSGLHQSRQMSWSGDHDERCYGPLFEAVERVPSALPETMKDRVRLGFLTEPSSAACGQEPALNVRGRIALVS